MPLLGARGAQQTALRFTSRAPPAVRPEAFGFEVVHQSSRSRARVGLIKTPHGVIETPAFVPVD
jgi:hypothetical protein